MSFNPSVEGKPLQQSLDVGWVKVCNEKFQSLCRGEASATLIGVVDIMPKVIVSIPLSRGSLCTQQQAQQQQNVTTLFQSLCRGEASATKG